MYDGRWRGCIVSSWEAAGLESFPSLFRDLELMYFIFKGTMGLGNERTISGLASVCFFLHLLSEYVI